MQIYYFEYWTYNIVNIASIGKNLIFAVKNHHDEFIVPFGVYFSYCLIWQYSKSMSVVLKK